MARDVVLVAGHYGDRNLGDDAIAQVLVRAITKKKCVKRIRILTLQDRPDFRCWGPDTDQLDLTKWSGIKLLIRSLFRIRVVIVGGGGILQDSTSVGNVILHTIFPLLLRAFGIRILVLGVGIGPLRYRISRFLVRLLLQASRFIVVRDPESYRLTVAMGIGRQKLIIAPDLAWGWHIGVEPTVTGPPKRVLISLRPPIGSAEVRRFPTGDYLTQLSLILAKVNKLAVARGLAVGLVATHPIQDVWMVNQVTASTDLFATRVTLIPNSPTDLLNTFQSGDVLVGMRLHAQIFAAMRGVPTVSLAYASKVSLAAEALSTSENVIPFPLGPQGLGELEDRLLAILNNYAVLSNAVRYRSVKLGEEVWIKLQQTVSDYV